MWATKRAFLILKGSSLSSSQKKKDRIWKNILYTRSLIPPPKEKPLPNVDKWQYYRRIAKKQLSIRAQLRLEWIIFYHTVGKKNISYTAEQFGISRVILHKWLKRFNEKYLASLEECSRKPHIIRDWTITSEEEKAIVQLRSMFIELGRDKLQVLYQTQYGKDISQWKIARIIRKHRLYPKPLKYKRYKQRAKGAQERLRIHRLREEIKAMKEYGSLWHMDTIIHPWYGDRRYIFTALEECTRIGFALVSTQYTSFYTTAFLKRLFAFSQGRIKMLHTDNGAEFQGVFEQTCKIMGIQQIYSRPHTPKDNAKLERFNRTLQREWLDFSVVGLARIEEANKDLAAWLERYNKVRPHAAIGYKTPMQYMEELTYQL